MPQAAAGCRIEPPVSLPSVANASPAAVAAPEPLEDAIVAQLGGALGGILEGGALGGATVGALVVDLETEQVLFERSGGGVQLQQ